jgi:hypothetical protein
MTDGQHWSDVARDDAVRHALGRAARAPSVHNTQPWQIRVDGDTVTIRADRTRQLTVADRRGRELVMSTGAALLNLRVGLAARAWGVEVHRMPDRDDPDLMAVVHVVPTPPEAELATLDPAVTRRRTNRRSFGEEQLPDVLLHRLSSAAAEEHALLVPVQSQLHRRLIARLSAEADGQQNADPAYRAELRRWTRRPAARGDGLPLAVLPRAEGSPREGVLAQRDFDTAGVGGLPPPKDAREQPLVLLTTLTDVPEAWLRAGEAMERVLLELTQAGWVAGPVTQSIEVAVIRSQVRAALCWDAHPQVLLRVGRAAPVPGTPRREHAEVVRGLEMTPTRRPVVRPESPTGRPEPEMRAVSDGRGGTTWS